MGQPAPQESMWESACAWFWVIVAIMAGTADD